MLNQVTIMGRLTKDPELRRTGSGTAVASFSIACEDDFASKGNEKQTHFFDCTAWRNTAEFISKYFTKGRMIIVTGRLTTREWTGNDGSKHRNVEIIADTGYFGDSKKDGGNAAAPAGGYNAPAPAGGGYNAPAPAGGYNAPAGGSYNAPAPAGGYGGYAMPPAPASDFAMLEDDAAQLPF